MTRAVSVRLTRLVEGYAHCSQIPWHGLKGAGAQGARQRVSYPLPANVKDFTTRFGVEV
jgi:hypothetical protein